MKSTGFLEYFLDALLILLGVLLTPVVVGIPILIYGCKRYKNFLMQQTATAKPVPQESAGQKVWGDEEPVPWTLDE